eukprot:6896467-Alexandrium_andersonii.AAC.1
MLNCTRTQAAVRPASVRSLNCVRTHRLQALGTRTTRPSARRGTCGPTHGCREQRPEADSSVIHGP